MGSRKKKSRSEEVEGNEREREGKDIGTRHTGQIWRLGFVVDRCRSGHKIRTQTAWPICDRHKVRIRAWMCNLSRVVYSLCSSIGQAHSTSRPRPHLPFPDPGRRHVRISPLAPRPVTSVFFLLFNFTNSDTFSLSITPFPSPSFIHYHIYLPLPTTTMAEPSLDRSEWDVVIVGTGFQESMLAL